MIVDSVPLVGNKARLLSPAGKEVNLVQERVGSLGPLPDGVFLDVEGLAVYMEGPAVLGSFRPGTEPLFTIELRKEVQPDLFLDPYCHRMHTVGGGDDLASGTLDNCEVLVIDGQDTLVSRDTSEDSSRSAVYRLREPVTFGHVGWVLAASKNAAGFMYGVTAELWVEGDDLDGDATSSQVLAAPGTTLDAERAVATDGWPSNVIAYRLGFSASVTRPGRIASAPRSDPGSGLGRALLRAVTLAERTDHAHAYHSLAEVSGASVDASLVPDTTAPQGFGGVIDFAARLEEDEEIAVRLGAGFDVQWFDARLVGTEHMRPEIRAPRE